MEDVCGLYCSQQTLPEGSLRVPTHRPGHRLYGWLRPFGAYAYTTMSFGLKNEGATYQRPIQLCLVDQLHRNVEAYLDDVLIKTRSHDEFIPDLEETFNSL
jgi:hypothetical protein